jgi:multicomponent Na+:H+ antiporter subunit C
MTWLASHFNYVAVAILMMAGLFIVFSSGNLIKRMIGLAMFQTSTGLFYITLSKVSGGTAAISAEGG